MHVEATTRPLRVRRRQPRGLRLAARWTVLVLAVLAMAATVVGLAFAGSAGKLADGITVAGVDVGGLSPAEAEQKLQQRARVLANVPVVFTWGGHSWPIRPRHLGIEPDWAGAVAAAHDKGDGLGPLRGLRRLGLRLFGENVAPRTEAWNAALAYHLRAFGRVVDDPRRDASLRWRGLRVVAVPGRGGRVLDRPAASRLVVSSLASLERRPVELPVRPDPQRVRIADLEEAAAQARTAVSAPVRLTLGRMRWRIARWRMAQILQLPKKGSRTLAIGGPGADRFFARLTKRVDRPPRNADFAIATTGVRVVPARDGRVVDVSRSAARLLAAAVSPTDRAAKLVVVTKSPTRSTEEARAMGITGVVGGYETVYGGDPNRIHNVRLVAQLIDKTLIAPGEEFSFNATTGERTPEKGFREAPVIINGELQNGIGGGVCQVSTTVFNAAYVAGLPITARTNHGLYIDHYPQGRDATVNYPDIDLRFVNDTGRWLLLRTFVGPSSLTVGLYGTPVDRRVETETAPLVENGEIPEERIADPTLFEGEEVVDQYGQPPRETSVHRRVFTAGGDLLYDDVWSSSYAAEPTVIRYGTKPRPIPEPSPEPPAVEGEEPSPAPSETTPEETTPATPEQEAEGVTPPR